MKYFIPILFISILSGCKSHMFENIVKDDSAFKDIVSTYKIDLENYKAYYVVIARNEDSLETIVTNYSASNTKLHITDVQYLLINDQMDRFIHIGNIPMRYNSGYNQYYLDTFAKDYSSKINLFYINQIHFGKIVGNKLIYKYKNSAYKESDKIVEVGFLKDQGITLTNFKSNKLEKEIILSSTVNSSHLNFTLMKNFDLVFYGADDNKSYEVKNEITLTTFDRSRINGHILFPFGNGKRNMVLFYLKGSKELKHKTVLGFWYGEGKERFKFLYPSE